MKNFSIVVPAYNEADKISTTITQIISFMRGFDQNFELIISDDGSKDNTTTVVEGMLKDNPELILLKNPHKGKGSTLWSGVNRADGEYIYLCDADLSTPISEIKKLLVWSKDQNFDIVIASREGLGAQRLNEPYYRHLMGRVFNLLVQILILPGINDTQCGFKLIKGPCAKDIFSRLKIYGDQAPIIDKAYMGAFDVEVLYLARKLKYKVKEVPVTWVYVKTTRLHVFADSIKMLSDVLKVRLNDMKGMYHA